MGYLSYISRYFKIWNFNWTHFFKPSKLDITGKDRSSFYNFLKTLSRDFIFPFIIVVWINNYKFQCLSIMFLLIPCFFYSIYFRPYSNPLNTFMTAFNESLYFLFFGALLVVGLTQESWWEATRYNTVGTPMVGVLAIAVLINVGLALFQVLFSVFVFYKTRKLNKIFSEKQFGWDTGLSSPWSAENWEQWADYNSCSNKWDSKKKNFQENKILKGSAKYNKVEEVKDKQIRLVSLGGTHMNVVTKDSKALEKPNERSDKSDSDSWSSNDEFSEV